MSTRSRLPFHLKYHPLLSLSLSLSLSRLLPYSQLLHWCRVSKDDNLWCVDVWLCHVWLIELAVLH